MESSTKNARITKNILTIIAIAALGVAAGFTVANTSQPSTSAGQQSAQNTPSQGGTPPDKPSKDNNSETPPEKPEGDDDQTPPDKPNGNSDGQAPNGTPPERPNDNNAQTQSDASSDNTALKITLFSVESVFAALAIIYLIMSGFNKKSFKETLHSSDKVLIFILSTIILSAALVVSEMLISNAISSSRTDTPQSQTQPGGGQSQASNVSATGAETVTDTQTLDGSYNSETSDESAILVKDGGTATISGTITKSGDSTNTENSEFYGVNAAILVTKNSTATIKNATIKTAAKGANAVFSTGENSKIYISDSAIESTGSSSARGLDATYGGYIEGKNLKITTQGGSCATLATDRGEGTVKVSNSELTTNGSGSPVIYSTGDISINESNGTANGSQMVVIEGKNSATVTNSSLTASAKGNRGNTDQAGVMIYQSMSGDASEGTGTFTATNSSLTINENSSYYKTAPMFFITNTDAVINLNSTTLKYGSNTLISAKGTSEWGKSGSNGGNLTFNAENETISGNVEADSISTITINMNNTSYTGTINGANTAKSIALSISDSSKITLTGDSYVTSFNGNKSNINFNGYKLYVNGESL